MAAQSSINLLDNPSQLYLSSLLSQIKEDSDWMYVYILASEIGVLYVGVTNNVVRRLSEHRVKLHGGFTAHKACTKLVYFEIFDTAGEAIDREKQIKHWSRIKKERLIKTLNPPWIDLSPLLPD